MKILISVPSGYHVRELLLPLKPLLEADTAIEKIICLTPGAPHKATIFSDYGSKFDFLENPPTPEKHEALLKQLSPHLVITSTAGLDTKDVPILEAAKKLNIKTFTFIASWDNVWKMERLKQFKKPYVLADHISVWNSMMKEHLLRAFPDVTEEMISITGVPRFDYFWHQDRIPSKEELFKYLNLKDLNKKLVHIATTELYPMDYLVEAIATANFSSKLHLYASVHPGGNMDKHKGYAQRHGVTVRYSFGRQDKALHPDFLYNPSLDDIYMLVAVFKYSSVLVNHSSTVAIESFAADVPVINVKYGRTLDWWHWYRSMVYRDFQQHYQDITADGATKVVKNKQQLLTSIETYLEHPEYERENRSKTLQKMITVIDGTSSAKMLALIKQQAS